MPWSGCFDPFSPTKNDPFPPGAHGGISTGSEETPRVLVQARFFLLIYKPFRMGYLFGLMSESVYPEGAWL